MLHRTSDLDRFFGVKVDLKETGCKDVDWTQLAQDKVQWQALVNMIMNLQVP
jgi:hypothetical protein